MGSLLSRLPHELTPWADTIRGRDIQGWLLVIGIGVTRCVEVEAMDWHGQPKRLTETQRFVECLQTDTNNKRVGLWLKADRIVKVRPPSCFVAARIDALRDAMHDGRI